MSSVLVRWALGGCAAVLLSACGGSRDTAEGPSPARGARAVTMLEDEQLADRSGSLLSVMQAETGGLDVRHTERCPIITFRGAKRFVAPPTPSIYVNGMRATNTCVLDELPAADVRRVEIYPSGVTSRPGYVNSADGLILVFLRGGGHIAER